MYPLAANVTIVQLLASQSAAESVLPELKGWPR